MVGIRHLFFGSTSEEDGDLMTGGSANTDDGTLIDDTNSVAQLVRSKSYQKYLH